jgi:hypothetical protein
VVILFPLQAFILICSIVVIVLGARTGITHVSKFDPTNTTHVIIASALGGKNGSLSTLNGENAIHADDKALNLKVEYRHDVQSFQEVGRGDGREYTELANLQPADEPDHPSNNRLSVRKPFIRVATG